jgi:hypothetical protein
MFGDPNPAMALPDLASLLSTIQSTYPQARITSGFRGPNNPLTQRNPASLHAQGSAADPHAVDVAPIPGVSFDQYVSSIRRQGVPITQAFDEAAHPFPWTTGPNWHLATGAAPQGAAPVQPYRKPKTLADIAAPDAAQQPVSLMSDPSAGPMQPQPQTLADLALPAANVKQPSKFNVGNILGVLGDALMAYGGLQPQFGPGLRRQQEDQRAQDFDREKFNAQIQLAQQKALEPPQFVQNLEAYLKMPPEQKRALLQYQDATNPINVSTPAGTQNVPRTTTKTINGKTYYNIGGDWFEETE